MSFIVGKDVKRLISKCFILIMIRDTILNDIKCKAKIAKLCFPHRQRIFLVITSCLHCFRKLQKSNRRVIPQKEQTINTIGLNIILYAKSILAKKGHTNNIKILIIRYKLLSILRIDGIIFK